MIWNLGNLKNTWNQLFHHEFNFGSTMPLIYRNASFVNPSTLYCLIYWYNIALYVILFLHLILIKLFFIKCLSSFDFLFDNQIRMRCKFMNNEKKEKL